jgi:pentatricopeptide repeat protein
MSRANAHRKPYYTILLWKQFTLQQHDQPPSLNMIKELIKAQGEIDGVNANMIQIFQTTTQISGLVPNTECFSGAIEVAKSRGDWVAAVACIDAIRARGLNPSPKCYSLAIQTCKNAKQFKMAEMLFRELKPFQLLEKDNAYINSQIIQIFPVMISMYSKAGNFEKAADLFKNLSNKGISSLPIINSMISCYSAQSKVSEAEELFRSLSRDYKLVPDGFSYSALMKGYMQIGNDEKVKMLEEEYARILEARGSKPLPLKSWKSVLRSDAARVFDTSGSVLLLHNNWLEAGRLFKKCLDLGVVSGAKTKGRDLILDLHGLSESLAKCGICWLLLVEDIVGMNIRVITGRGKHCHDESRVGLLNSILPEFISDVFSLRRILVHRGHIILPA